MLKQPDFIKKKWSGGFTFPTPLVVRPLKKTLFYVCLPLGGRFQNLFLPQRGPIKPKLVASLYIFHSKEEKFIFRKGKEKEFPMAQNLSRSQKRFFLKMRQNYFLSL